MTSKLNTIAHTHVTTAKQHATHAADKPMQSHDFVIQTAMGSLCVSLALINAAQTEAQYAHPSQTQAVSTMKGVDEPFSALRTETFTLRLLRLQWQLESYLAENAAKSGWAIAENTEHRHGTSQMPTTTEAKLITCLEPIKEVITTASQSRQSSELMQYNKEKDIARLTDLAGQAMVTWIEQSLCAQLTDYLLGTPTHWSLPTGEALPCAKSIAYYQELLKQHLPSATEFQRLVWSGCLTIAHGQTTTYQALAQRINRPNASRAVAGALKMNPWTVIIPCHRVVSTQGLGGYMGASLAGQRLKQQLLAIEQQSLPIVR